MPKVTSVEPQKKPGRFNIFLDGIFAFGADEDLVVEHRLVTGKALEESDTEKLLFEAEAGKLMERMYRLWNIRPRSEKEVKDYFRIKQLELRIKGKEQISDLAIELVIKKLKQKGFLNDKQFAKAWAEARSKKKSKREIKQELYQKGIDRDLIKQVLEEIDLDEAALAIHILEKKAKAWKNLPRSQLQKKAFEFLLRRGFEYSVVKETIENLLKKR